MATRSKKRKRPLAINAAELVKLSVSGEIIPAVWPAARLYRLGGDGVSRVLPGTGGICYSHQVGDSVCRIRGDHVEPGVTMRHSDKNFNASLNVMSCVGNEGVVISGPAEGAKGVVCGTHGGVEHVILDFPESTLKKLRIGDKIQIIAHGVGLELTDHPEVQVMNCDPRLLAKWGITADAAGKLHVPVTHTVPAKIMGSGLGSPTSHKGDYDIQMFDEAIVKEHGLDSLRFGDLVAILDADHAFGWRYLSGAVSIGVIVHSRSDVSGHGPGVASLLTAKDGALVPRIDGNANLGKILGIGRWRRSRAKK
jgi:hypothetical protein